MTRAAWWSPLCVAAALFGLGGCREYGSIASLATPDVRLPPGEYLGTWRAPDELRCHNGEFGDGTRFSVPYHVFTVDTTRTGELRMTGRPDRTCGTPAADSIEYRGALVQLDGRRYLEFRAERTPTDATVPLFQWMRLGARGDTLLLEPLWADSLGAWLERAPNATPHRLSDAVTDDQGRGTIVLTGDARQLRAFVRKAFSRPAVIFPDTLVFVRDRPELRGPPRS